MENPVEITAEQIEQLYEDAPAQAQDEGDALVVLEEEGNEQEDA